MYFNKGSIKDGKNTINAQYSLLTYLENPSLLNSNFIY